MKFSKLFHLVFVLSLMTSVHLSAQEYNEFVNEGYNPNSLRPVHESNLVYQKTIWLRMSLKEKQNQAFFANGQEITKVIIEAARAGIIRPYMNDSLRTRMSHEEFLKNLIIPTEMSAHDDLPSDFWDTDEDEFDDWTTGQESLEEEVSDEYFPHQLYILELKEDVLFDKKRSRMVHDIQAITLVVPAEMNAATGLEKPIATFSYKELVQNLFGDNPNTYWYNAKNNRNHLNLAHAFDLRLFDAHIIKYDNPQNESIVDIYSDGLDSKTSIINSMTYQYYLVEYESNLWEN